MTNDLEELKEKFRHRLYVSAPSQMMPEADHSYATQIAIELQRTQVSPEEHYKLPPVNLGRAYLELRSELQRLKELLAHKIKHAAEDAAQRQVTTDLAKLIADSEAQGHKIDELKKQLDEIEDQLRDVKKEIVT